MLILRAVPEVVRLRLLQLHKTVPAHGHEECSMSDTTPNDGNTKPHGDAAPAFREPEAIDYASAPVDTAPDGTGSDGSGYAERDGAHSEVTVDQVQEARPVTAEPPAVDGVTVDEFGETEITATSQRETSVPTATASGSSATANAAADDTATSRYPEYTQAPAAVATAAPVQPTPIYVQAPTPPRNRGNRGPGILIALLATVVFAILYAIIVSIISGITSATLAEAMTTFSEFVVRPVFYVPVIFFFIAFALLVSIVNRSGWWAYVLGGFLVAVVVYFSYIGGALLTVQAWNLTPSEAGRFVASQWLNPGAIAAAVLAREVPIWFGSWIARNGRKVTARNIEARKEYDRQIAEGPQLVRQ
jgi:hypothetical protein